MVNSEGREPLSNNSSSSMLPWNLPSFDLFYTSVVYPWATGWMIMGSSPSIAPGTHWIGGKVGPRAVLDAVLRKIPSPRQESHSRTIVQSVVQRYTDWAIMAPNRWTGIYNTDGRTLGRTALLFLFSAHPCLTKERREAWGSMDLWNGILPHYAASQPRRPRLEGKDAWN